MSDQLQQMLASFQALADSIRNVSIGNSIQRAQQQVDTIRQNQELNDFEKIKAQQQLARTVGGEVMRYGGNAFMAQQAMASLAPDVPNMQMAQLEATGKATFAEAAQELQNKQEELLAKREQRAFAREKQMLDLKAAAEERLAKAKEAGKVKPLTRPEEEKLYNLLDRQTSLKDLLAQFDEKAGAVGPVAGRIPDIASSIPGAGLVGFTPEATAYRMQVMQDFNEYRRIVTGAAASIPELKSIRLATLNETDTGDNFKAKAQAILDLGQKVSERRIRIAERQGKDVSAFKQEFVDQSVQAPDRQMPATNVGGGGGFTVKWSD